MRVKNYNQISRAVLTPCSWMAIQLLTEDLIWFDDSKFALFFSNTTRLLLFNYYLLENHTTIVVFASISRGYTHGYFVIIFINCYAIIKAIKLFSTDLETKVLQNMLNNIIIFILNLFDYQTFENKPLIKSYTV